MGRFVFIPAMIMQLRNMYYANKKWKGFGVNSFTDDAIDPYDHLLVSSWWESDWEKNKQSPEKPTFRDVCSIRKNITLFGDSGGFQAESKGIELDVEFLSSWQLKNCDFYMGFDVPPDHVRSNGVARITTDAEFRQKTEQTYQNNLKLLNTVGEDKLVNYYNVMQGITLDRRNYFYDKLSQLPFQKYAVACRPSGNAVLQAFAVCHLHSKGFEGVVHVLGVGGYTVIPIFPYLKDLFEHLTIDSSTYGQGARTREYFTSTGEKYYLGTTKDDPVIEKNKTYFRDNGLPCDCLSCRSIVGEEIEHLWGEGTLGGSLITVHNLRTTLNYVDELNNVYDNEGREYYKKYIHDKLHTTNKTHNLFIALDLIDFYIESKSIEKTYHKFIRYLRTNEDIPKEHNSLF